MLGRLTERWRRQSRTALRIFAFGAGAAACIGVALLFLCVAAFIAALERYGAIDACLAAAATFLVVAILLTAVRSALAARRRREAAAAPPPSPSPLADPNMILIGLQIAQAVGLKRLLPILAVGGAAFALASAAKPSANGRRTAARRNARADVAQPPAD